MHCSEVVRGKKEGQCGRKEGRQCSAYLLGRRCRRMPPPAGRCCSAPHRTASRSPANSPAGRWQWRWWRCWWRRPTQWTSHCLRRSMSSERSDRVRVRRRLRSECESAHCGTLRTGSSVHPRKRGQLWVCGKVEKKRRIYWEWRDEEKEEGKQVEELRSIGQVS